MDPTECLRRFLQHVRNGERLEANEAWQNLRDWLASGGFEPAWGAVCTIVYDAECQAIILKTALPTRKEWESYDMKSCPRCGHLFAGDCPCELIHDAAEAQELFGDDELEAYAARKDR